MNTFAQEYIELIKCDRKDIYNVLNSRVVLQNDALLNFLFIKESWKKCIKMLSLNCFQYS